MSSTRIGNEGNSWTVSGPVIDVSRGAQRPCKISSDSAELVFSPEHSALLVIDMQNYFCAPQLSRSESSLNLVPAIRTAIADARRLQMHIGWVSWGNRMDLANLPPSLVYSFRRNSAWGGIGGELPGGLGPALIRESWSARLISGLDPEPHDWQVDKYRLSGFHGTVLDQILRNHAVTTLFFAGVNVDQCVWGTMLDASYLGYDTILLRDCAATSSPNYAEQATHYNVLRIGGFITTSTQFHTAELSRPEEASGVDAIGSSEQES